MSTEIHLVRSHQKVLDTLRAACAGGPVELSRNELAARTGLSIHTIKVATRVLVRHGLIVAEYRTGPTGPMPNVYRLPQQEG